VLGHELPEAEVHDLRDGLEERENPWQNPLEMELYNEKNHYPCTLKLEKSTINVR
jgi:hypothetical protein